MSGKPGSANNGAPGGAATDRNAVKKNLNLAIDIINSVFHANAPKSV